MIRNHVLPGQKLAVGNPEYKDIIQEKMKICCLCDEAVMELMWGLRYQMRCLVPAEKSELAKADWLPMCEEMKFVLNHYGFDSKSEMMVNKRIVEKVAIVYECDLFVEKHSDKLHRAVVSES